MKKIVRTLGIVVLAIGLAAASRAAGFEELAANLWSTTLAAMSLQKTNQASAQGSNGPSAAARIVEISISGMKFSPAVVTIAKGDWVRWTNNDAEEHTATGRGRVFDTGTIMAGRSEQARFNTDGAFMYFCSFHPMMKGRIVVQ